MNQHAHPINETAYTQFAQTTAHNTRHLTQITITIRDRGHNTHAVDILTGHAVIAGRNFAVTPGRDLHTTLTAVTPTGWQQIPATRYKRRKELSATYQPITGMRNH